MQISYERYLDQIMGGWIGKSMGGAIGARFEGNKGWIEIDPSEMFPVKMPPNDDLDLQVLWLKVLEEKGAALDSDDLAAAWLEGCWYPYGELVTERDEVVWWAPFNNMHRVTLRRGENHFLVNLLKRGDELRFTLGIKEGSPAPAVRAMLSGVSEPQPNDQADKPPVQDMLAAIADWMVDLSDACP